MHTEGKGSLGTPGGHPPCCWALCLLLAPVAASTGLANDCDLNGREDALEIAADPRLDCNQNGVLDLCDVEAFGPFLRPRAFPGPAFPSSIWRADLTGDGRADLLVEGSELRLYETDPRLGLHDLGSELGAPVDAGSVLGVADVDGEGHLDIVRAAKVVHVLHGLGNGQFEGRIASQLLEVFRFTGTMGDLDGDGDVDAAFGGIARFVGPAGVETSLAVQLNDGGGTFLAGQVWTVEGGDLGPVIDDWDRDGQADIVFGGYVSRGRGAGRFGVPFRIDGPFPAFRPLFDLNGDGLLDYMTTLYGSPELALTLQSAPGVLGVRQSIPVGHEYGQLVAGDLDADGDQDIVLHGTGVSTLASHACTLLNDGTARFDAGPCSGIPNGNSRAILNDFDADGRPEAVFAAESSAIFVLDLLGPGQVHSPPAVPVSQRVLDFGGDQPRLVDLDLDSEPDLLLRESAGFYYLRNINQLPATRPTKVNVGPESRSCEPMDLDGDGDDDFVVLASSVPNGPTMELRLHEVDGGGVQVVRKAEVPGGATVLKPLAEAAEGAAARVVLGYFRGIAIFPIDKLGLAGPSQQVPLAEQILELRTVDLDGDGHKEIVAVLVTREIQILVRGADGRYAPGVLLPPPLPASVLRVLEPQAPPPGKAGSLFIVHEEGSFVQVTWGAGGPEVKVLTTSPGLAHGLLLDVDGDGRDDLLTLEHPDEARENLPALRLRKGSSTGGFESAREVLQLLSTGSLLTADLDHDERPDLVAHDASSLLLLANVGISLPTEEDCDHNGTPDACQPDCGTNGIPDACETDCDRNNIPDECEILGSPELDTNGDGALDVCEIRPTFHRGNINGDNTFDISDAVSLLLYLFASGQVACLEAGDVDNDGQLDVTDAIVLLRYQFLDGPALAPPGPPPKPCGPDTDRPHGPGDLGCSSYPGCGT